MRDGGWSLVRCNFRGEPKGTSAPGVPEGFLDGFIPTKLVYAGGKIYVVCLTAMKVLVVDPSGAMVAAHDREADGERGQRADLGLGGFSVDGEGNLLFTIPVQFAAFIVAPSGEIRRFGQKGARRASSRSSPASAVTPRATCSCPTSSSRRSSCSTVT